MFVLYYTILYYAQLHYTECRILLFAVFGAADLAFGEPELLLPVLHGSRTRHEQKSAKGDAHPHLKSQRPVTMGYFP